MGRNERFGTELGRVLVEITFKPSVTEESILRRVPMGLTFQPTGNTTGSNNVGKCDVGIGVNGVIDEHGYVGTVVIGTGIGVIGKGTKGKGNIGVIIVGVLNELKHGNVGSDIFANAGERVHEEVSVGVVIGIEGRCCCRKKVRT